MQGKYDVCCGGEKVGVVELHREGLYYRLSCRCHGVDREIHRLYADGERIGVLIPEGAELVLHTKVATKRLKAGCSFSLDENKGAFIPIRVGEEFAHLDKVRLGKLKFRDGAPGLYLEK